MAERVPLSHYGWSGVGGEGGSLSNKPAIDQRFRERSERLWCSSCPAMIQASARTGVGASTQAACAKLTRLRPVSFEQ